MIKEEKEQLVTELAVHGNQKIYEVFRKLGFNDVHSVVYKSIENREKANYRDVMIEYTWFQEIVQNGSEWYNKIKEKAEKYDQQNNNRYTWILREELEAYLKSKEKLEQENKRLKESNNFQEKQLIETRRISNKTQVLNGELKEKLKIHGLHQIDEYVKLKEQLKDCRELLDNRYDQIQELLATKDGNC